MTCCFFRFANTSKPFACKDIKIALTEIMELTNSLDQAKEKVGKSLVSTNMNKRVQVALTMTFTSRCARRKRTSARLWKRGMSSSALWTSELFSIVLSGIFLSATIFPP